MLSLLKASSDLTGLVPAANIHSQSAPKEPAWPFLMLGPPTTQRLRMPGCVNGGVGAFDVHAFAGPRESTGQVVETAEDHCGRIGGFIEAALADARFDLSGGEVLKIELSDMQLMQDGEPDAYHYVCQVNWRVLAA